LTVEACARQIRERLGEAWLARIYRERILKLRTRSYHFDSAGIPTRIVIQHTLLGVELKVGRKRLLCPDLATARYLSLFARLGCKDVALPYDITKISQFADELESSWYRMLLLVDDETKAKSASFKSRVRGSLVAAICAEIAEAGAGTRIPEFKQSTRRPVN
jgi:hypothetical protein